jgi:hypothetical protein
MTVNVIDRAIRTISTTAFLALSKILLDRLNCTEKVLTTKIDYDIYYTKSYLSFFCPIFKFIGNIWYKTN